MANPARRVPSEGSGPLRVLIGADTFAPEISGASTFEVSLAAGLVARGHEVHMMAPAYGTKPGAYQEVLGGQTMTVHRIRSWRWYPHPTFRFMLPWRTKAEAARVIDLVKPDVIHFQSHIVVGRGLTLEGQKRGIRLIGTNHFMPENLLDHAKIIPPFLVRRAIRLAWNAADRSFSRAERVTTPTRKAAEYLEANTSVSGVLAISCGIDAHNYTPSFEPRTENLIVFLGRVVEEKQIDKLIRAVAKLDPALKARVQLMGSGDQEQRLTSLATQLGIADRVQFDGRVSDEHVRETLTKATVFAMPSIAELQSISTMEAMASGLPIVAANAMALPHLVHDGENGFLFEPGNVDDLADKLTRVLTMPAAELEKFKRESLAIVEAHDIQRTLDTFESLYRGEEPDAR